MRTRRRPPWLTSVLSALALACAAAPRARAVEPGEAPPPEDELPVPAEPAEEEEEEEIDVRVYLEEDEEAEGLLKAAARLVEDEDWRRAIRTYMEVIRRFPHTVTRVAGQPRLRRPTPDVVLERLAELPAEALDLYRVLYDGAAKAALDRARRTMDEGAIAKVAEEYFVSSWGDDALFLLGELALARGEPRKALACYERVLRDYPRVGGEDPDAGVVNLAREPARGALELRAIQAAALSLGPGPARARLKAVRDAWDGDALRVGHEKVKLVEKAEALIAAALSPAPRGRDEVWPTFGVDSAHLGRCASSVKPGLVAWDFKPQGQSGQPSPRRTPFVHPALRGRVPAGAERVVPLSRNHATATGNRVYFTDGGAVWAFEPMTGRLKWRYQTGRGRAGGVAVSFVTVADGRAFAVFGGSAAQVNRGVWMGGRPAQRQGEPARLVAFRAPGGKMLWTTSDLRDPEARKLLAGGEFPCAPTADARTVYAPFVRHASMADAYLIAFDAGTGRVLWSSFLCSGFTMSRMGRSSGQPAALAGGALYFVTDLGAAAAADALTGRVRWIMLYDRIEPKTDPRGRMVRPDVVAWESSAPVVAGGRLLIAPQDSNWLYALSTETGRILWRTPRGKLRTFLGVAGEIAVCSGDEGVTAFYLASGKRAWSMRVPDAVVGRGFLTAERAYVPTRKGLLEVELAGGRRGATAVWPDPKKGAGNLLVVGDVVVSARDDGLTAFFAWDQVHAKLSKAIAAAPGDAIPKLEMGDIYYKTEAYAEAIGWYLKATAQAKPGMEYHGEDLRSALRDRLYGAHWDRAERVAAEKPAAAIEDYRTAQGYALKKEERALAQLRIARAHERLGNLPQAVTDLQEAIARFGPVTCRDKDRAFPTAREAETRLWRLLKAHGREVYAAEEKKASLALARARGEEGTAALEEVLRLYPTSEIAEEALVLLSDRRLAAGDVPKALAALRRLLGRPSLARSRAEIHARLALACEKGDFRGMWRSQLRRIEREHAKNGFKLGEKAYTGASFVEERRGANPELVKAALRREAPALRPPLVERWTRKGSYAALPGQEVVGTGAVVVRASGIAQQGNIRRRGSRLQILDAEAGEVRWQEKDFEQVPSPAAVVQGVLYRMKGNAVEARSLVDARVLWRTEMELVASGARGALPYYGLRSQGMEVSPSAVAVCESGKAVAVLDPATGKLIWRTALENAQGVALVTEDLVVARVAESDADPRFAGRRVTKMKLAALDLATGLKRFELTLPTPAAGTVHAAADRLVVAAASGRTDINAYDPLTGKLVWRIRPRASRYANLRTRVLGEEVVVTVMDYRQRKVSYEVFDAVSGKCTLRGHLPGRMHPVAEAADGERLYFAFGQLRTGRGGLVALDRKSGKTLWETRPPHDGALLWALRARDGALALYAQPGGSRLCLVDWGTGKVRWAKRLAGTGAGQGGRVVFPVSYGRVGAAAELLGDGHLFLTVANQEGMLLGPGARPDRPRRPDAEERPRENEATPQTGGGN